jgi:type VI secretion system protein ImpK
MDEIILSSSFGLRDEWERMPLQLRLFGEHLAGEHFFTRLEALRLDPHKNLELLEVYYTCLLLGFRGKYLLEGQEKLDYLKQKLGQEIQQARGGKAEFAPNWRLPQRFQAYMRHELPMWLYFALLAAVGIGIYGTYRLLLSHLSGQLFG